MLSVKCVKARGRNLEKSLMVPGSKVRHNNRAHLGPPVEPFWSFLHVLDVRLLSICSAARTATACAKGNHQNGSPRPPSISKNPPWPMSDVPCLCLIAPQRPMLQPPFVTLILSPGGGRVGSLTMVLSLTNVWSSVVHESSVILLLAEPLSHVVRGVVRKTARSLQLLRFLFLELIFDCVTANGFLVIQTQSITEVFLRSCCNASDHVLMEVRFGAGIGV